MCDYEMIEKLTCVGHGPLWDIKAPFEERVEAMKKVRDALKAEHDDACNDDDVGPVDTGVLLGALNLVEGLLQDVEV